MTWDDDAKLITASTASSSFCVADVLSVERLAAMEPDAKRRLPRCQLPRIFGAPLSRECPAVPYRLLCSGVAPKARAGSSNGAADPSP